MNTRWLGFGEIELEGKRYDADVVIEYGQVRRRRKKPSKRYRDRFGHTPLSERADTVGRPPLDRGHRGGRSPADHGGGLRRGGAPERRDRRAAH